MKNQHLLKGFLASCNRESRDGLSELVMRSFVHRGGKKGGKVRDITVSKSDMGCSPQEHFIGSKTSC